MRRKLVRLFISIILLFSIFTIALDVTSYSISACACGTWNGSVISGLNYLQEFIDQYAQEHNGEYPSYQSVFLTMQIHVEDTYYSQDFPYLLPVFS